MVLILPSVSTLEIIAPSMPACTGIKVADLISWTVTVLETFPLIQKHLLPLLKLAQFGMFPCTFFFYLKHRLVRSLDTENLLRMNFYKFRRLLLRPWRW